MANYQYIDVKINPDGKIEIEVSGVKGKNCLDLTKGLEDACGGEIESREMKRDCFINGDDNCLTEQDHCKVKE